MKILVIANSTIPVPPRLYGGSQRMVFNLCKGLNTRKISVNLLSCKGSQTFMGKTLNYVDYRFGTSILGRCLSWAEFQVQCMRLIKDVDLVHSSILLPERLFSLNKFKKPIIYKHGNTPKSNDFRRIIKANPKRGFLQCVSKNQISKIEITDPDKAFVTYNCVDTHFFKRENVDKEDFFLYLGRLNYDKGIDIAVRLSMDSGIPLKIAGPLRSNEKEATKLFNERVKPFLGNEIEYVGEVDDFKKRTLLSKAKALIVPNRWDEPFGLMNIEALACGTPIVSTNKGSLGEIIMHGKTGFLCNSYDELLECIGNVDYLSEKSCREDAEKRFSFNTFLNETERIYKAIL